MSYEVWFAFAGGCAGVWLSLYAGIIWVRSYLRRASKMLHELPPEVLAHALRNMGVTEVHAVASDPEVERLVESVQQGVPAVITLPVDVVVYSVLAQLRGGKPQKP